MKTHHTIGLFFLLLVSVSCQTQEFNEMDLSVISFYATAEPETRTQIGTDNWGRKTVKWNPSDEITVFCKNGKGKFVSTNTEATANKVEFVGALNNEPERGTEPYWAVYPHREDNTFDGEAVGVTLSSVQVAMVDNVRDSLLVSVARSWDRNLYFYNLCGIISIPVYEDGIKRIVFRGNDNEPLAGRAFAEFDESGIPIISRFDNPSLEITLFAPEMGTFNQGDLYNIVCFPGRFDKGYTIEFYRDDLVSIKQIDSPVSLSRAGFVDLTDLYSGGTIYSLESEGRTYSLSYRRDRQTDSTTYWVSVNGTVFEIPEKFHTMPDENPTRIGPAVAIDTNHETVYFAKSYYYPDSSWNTDDGVVYRINSSGYDKKDIPVAYYPYFRTNENGLELHSFEYQPFVDGKYYHHQWGKMSYNHWVEQYWGDDGSGSVDYDMSGYGKKILSDVILLFQEKDIPDYPKDFSAIDLGLSVKWGSCNLGATTSESYGDRFAWGETTTKDSFTLENYRFGDQDDNGGSWRKYNHEDEKYFLDSEDDAAHIQLGEDWRIPSPDEWRELIENCTWEWFFLHGAAGLKATSKINGKCIFFPVDNEESHYYSLDQYAETGYYHSSHIYDDWEYGAVHMFETVLYDSFFSDSEGRREEGCAIRPVYGHIAIEEFQLDKHFTHINSGESAQLNVSVLPTNASGREITWSSSHEAVATVSPDGLVTGISSGTTFITATSVNGEKTDRCQVVVNLADAPQIVDLGLSVKWAAHNVGASSPDDVGLYFSWGEVEPKDDYSYESYKWWVNGPLSLTKYCPDPANGFNGFSDNKQYLDPEDDAAHVFYGEKWRMPTGKEIEELCHNTSSVAATLNGVDGYWITSLINGNRIFLPLTGCRWNDGLDSSDHGYYWSSSIYPGYDWDAYCLSIDSFLYLDYRGREEGLPIRGVYDDSGSSGGNEGITPGDDINM